MVTQIFLTVFFLNYCILDRSQKAKKQFFLKYCTLSFVLKSDRFWEKFLYGMNDKLVFWFTDYSKHSSLPLRNTMLPLMAAIFCQKLPDYKANSTQGWRPSSQSLVSYSSANWSPGKAAEDGARMAVRLVSLAPGFSLAQLWPLWQLRVRTSGEKTHPAPTPTSALLCCSQGASVSP